MYNKHKKLVCTVLILSALVSESTIALAYDDDSNQTEIHYETSSNIKKTLSPLYASNESMQEQLNKLYKDISELLDIPYTYVKAVHIIAGGKAVYSDRRPDIYTDITLESVPGPFEIAGVTQIYDKEAPFAKCADEEVQRPNKYYMPDAAYNVMSSIKSLMDTRYTVDRGNMQAYFDALLPDAKKNVVFYEALMQYLGYSDEQVNSLYKAYERVLYKKEKDEYVIELSENGEYSVKDKFIDIFKRYGIDRTDGIAIAMGFDSLLAQCDTPDKIKSEVPLHYKVGYTSRENMMIAAMSVVGKVRYVWGGGHGGTGNISGINPIWECFNELYGDNDKSGSCIKPSNTWCPVHGAIGSTSNTCMISDTTVSNISEYIAKRGSYIENTKAYGKIAGKNLNKIFNYGNVGYTRKDGSGSSVAAHRIEGLDCSGFASWLYNQIDSDRIYDSGASRFVQNGRLNELEMGSKLLPGDVLAWNTHICVIVGRTDETNKVYIEVESTPNVVKLGVAYYPGATQEQINKAKDLAKQANTLLGDVQDSWVNVFNIKNLEYATQAYTDEEGNVQYSYSKVLTIGRLNKSFIDEDEIVDGYNKTMNEMTAKEIIQNTIDSLPMGYLSGAEVYSGGDFNYVK